MGYIVVKKMLLAKMRREMANDNTAPINVEVAQVESPENVQNMENVNVEIGQKLNKTRHLRLQRKFLSESERKQWDESFVSEVVQRENEEPQPKKICRSRKFQEKNIYNHLKITKSRKSVKNITAAKGRAKKANGSSRSLARSKPEIRNEKQQQDSNSIMSKTTSEESSQVVCLSKPQPTPKWSNGWSWEGTSFESKVFLNSDGAPVIRKCYSTIRHYRGDVICTHDCVLLKSGPRKIDLPYVAKVAAMWENPDDGEMMLSLLWYYRPEQTDQGRRPDDEKDEVFESRHKDVNSVACIEGRCFVLSYNEYCRYHKDLQTAKEGLTDVSCILPTPESSSYSEMNRQLPGQVAADRVFFCRKVYDFRKRRLLKKILA